LQRLAGSPGIRFAAEVAQTDDTAQLFLLVDHRQAADLRFAHPVRSFLDVLVMTGANDVVGHEVANQGFRTVALGDAAHGDVAVGDHADQLVALGDGDRSGIGAQHERRGFMRLLVRTDGLDVAGHHFMHLHARSPIGMLTG